MAAATGGETHAGIGPRLRAAREKKGLTLLQAAERMHVDSRILESLEAENFAALGAPVYARGHLRHYAELVDESPAELQALYTEATKAQPALPDLTRIARAEPLDDSRRLAGPAFMGVIAVAVIGSVWWVINLSGTKVQPTYARNTPASSSAVAPTAAGSSGTDGTNSTGQPDTGAGNPAAVSQPAAESRRPSPASKPAVTTATKTSAATKVAAATAPANSRTDASAAPGGARSNASATAVSAARSGTAAGAAATSTAPPPARVGAVTPVSNTPATVPNPTSRTKDGELTLKFSSDSWAEVYDASGQRLFYDVGTASSAHTVKGPAPLHVVLGNASGVALEYNGRPALVPASNQPDGSARFMINARGRAVPASATAP
jgi:cytoskeleton protein RodZ